LKNWSVRFIVITLTAAVLSSCLGTRFLQDDQYLLRKQKIKGNNAVADEALEPLLRQEPNKTLLFFPIAPYVYVYQFGQRRYDKAEITEEINAIQEKYEAKIAQAEGNESKIKRLQARLEKRLGKKKRDLEEGNIYMRWGEPVAVYDSAAAAQSRQQFELYYENKGFFEVDVEKQVEMRGKRAFVSYHIDEGQPHRIDTVIYETTDSVLYNIIDAHRADAALQQGARYDQQDLVAERERIEILLKNHGYFDLSRQYISYTVDTLETPHEADIRLIINEPARRGYHKVFTVDSIIFVTDAGLSVPGARRQSTQYKNITFQYFDKRFSKNVLDQRVFIKKDSLYSFESTLNTQRQLALLDNFKFININYDTTGGMFVANIFASPLKRFQATNEVGLNVTEGFPGPFYNLSFRQRNVFGGLENLELSGFFGFEGVASATADDDIYSSTEAGGKLALTFPQFVIPSSERFRYRMASYNPTTTVRTGYNFTQRPEYERTNFNSAIVYNWQEFRRKLYSFTLAELSFIRSDTTREFGEILRELEAQGNPLIRSFNPSFVNSMNFFVIYNFNPNDLTGGKSSLLKLYAEAGGTIFNVLDPAVVTNRGLEYYQFLKFNIDFRRHISLGEHRGIASRINLGVAYPYGENKTLPYEKFFFAGGSNSIRAWQPRRLGPGSFPPDTTLTSSGEVIFDYSIEKPGEILLEASLEYRSKLISFIDWAFFIDAGNVWRLYEDVNQPGAEFRLNRFYKEIAIGTGLGLRFNFQFLVIRFDYGIKMYDPARPEGDRWIGDEISLTNLRGAPNQAIWNIAIGYPF
jgi:outer membrane protein assembly factor BamA